VVVSNIGALSNLGLAVRGKPEVALLQELWASAADITAEAKKHGYVAAVAEGASCLAAVLYRPGSGQQLKLPVEGTFAPRVAAAVVSLGGGCGCCFASVYGIANSTIGQKKELDQALDPVASEFRSLGRGSCCIGGDLNAEQQELGALSNLGRAGWADWSAEPTCITANCKTPRRIDQVWLSPEMQARWQSVSISWVDGLKTHALQRGTFREGPADQYQQWVLGDAGPEEGEEGFTDIDFMAAFVGKAGEWNEARRNLDVTGMWAALEKTIVQCHQIRSPLFRQPKATTKVAAEEPKRNLFTGDAASQELDAATLRKRRLQQWLAFEGRPECSGQLKQLMAAMAEDPVPRWAVVGKAPLPRAMVEELVALARAEEDEARGRSRAARKCSWHQWCAAQTEGGMRALFRWIREGPRSLQSTGILVQDGKLYAGQRALLEASEAAWRPVWQNPRAPKWERVNSPRRTEGWKPEAFTGWELWHRCWAMAPDKAPSQDGWTSRRMR
jgi:hypothetical protein